MSEPTAGTMIPQQLQDRLIAMADQGDSQEWEIGDACVEYFDLYWADVKAEFPKAKKGDVYKWFASFCNRKPDTVRMYHRVSAGVSNAMRDEFDMLGRHHHKAILTYSLGEAGEHRRLCTWWLEQSDEFGGKIGPVHALEAALRAQVDPNPDPAWRVRLKRILAQLDKLSEDQEAPQIVRDNAGAAIVALEQDEIRIGVDEGGPDGDFGARVQIRTDYQGASTVDGVEIFRPAPKTRIEEVSGE